MDMSARIAKIALFFIMLSVAGVGAAGQKPHGQLMWSSNYDYFCNGPCVSAFKSKNGLSFEFIDPANGTSRFSREIPFSDGLLLGKPRSLSELDLLDPKQKESAAHAVINTVPSPPGSGSGVITVENPIYDSYGHIVGSVIIYYVYRNGVLVDVIIEQVIVTNHNHAER